MMHVPTDMVQESRVCPFIFVFFMSSLFLWWQRSSPFISEARMMDLATVMPVSGGHKDHGMAPCMCIPASCTLGILFSLIGAWSVFAAYVVFFPFLPAVPPLPVPVTAAAASGNARFM
eukprot:scaffold247774_cov22-Tisochrysis_lutea.AAC.1